MADETLLPLTHEPSVRCSPTRRPATTAVRTPQPGESGSPRGPDAAVENHRPRSRGTAALLALADHPLDAPPDHLDRVVRTAVAEIDGARWVTVTVPRGGVMTTVAASDRIAALIDQAQSDADDGPVLTIPPVAGAVVHSCDLIADRRWPRFAPLALQLGAGAALCHRIGAPSGPAGVLSIYADRRHAFSVDSDRVARLLAVYAGIALDAEVLQRSVRAAARSRYLIGQAKGILMERLHVPSTQASAILVSASESRRTTVREVAERLVTTGEML